MEDKIAGLVHSDVRARKGKNWENESVIEVRAFYSANDQHGSTQIVVFSEAAARELLIDLTCLLD